MVSPVRRTLGPCPSSVAPSQEGEQGAGLRSRGLTGRRLCGLPAAQIHVERSVKELILEAREATRQLTQDLGRVPTESDLARHLGVSGADLREAQRAEMAFQPSSHLVIGGAVTGTGLSPRRLSSTPIPRPRWPG
jgi:hypothetical protein